MSPQTKFLGLGAMLVGVVVSFRGGACAGWLSLAVFIGFVTILSSKR